MADKITGVEAMDYRHANNTERILTGELQEGDLNWREGHLFRVTNLRRYPQHDGSPDVIRFDGVVVENAGETDSLKGTGYDSACGRPAVYGAHAEVPTSIVKRSLTAKTASD